MFNCQLSFAQNAAPIQWTWPNLLWSDTVWKYQGGIAKPEYFEPGFDDQHWQTVNEDFLQLEGNKSGWPGIGVFRKKFNVPDSLRGKRVELTLLLHCGASAIYLDGKPITRFGNVTENAKEEIIKLVLSVPISLVQFELDSQSSHLLAIYYSNHSAASINSRIGIRGFTIRATPISPAIEDTKVAFPHFIISMFLILSFSLFFWCVYAFYPYRLASLMSALLLTNFSLIFVGGNIRQATNEIKYFILGDDIWRIAFTCHSEWYLLFMYSIYYKRMPKRSWIPVVLMTMGSLLSIYSAEFPLKIIIPLVILFYLETWRIIILGIRKKRTGFWILAIGLFLSNLGSVNVIFDVFHLFPWYITVAQTTLAIVTDLSFPLTLLLQFAWEFGSANRDLQLQLAHVNDLSKKNLEQEQEKQQILFMQNETLEQQVSERTAQVVAQNKEIEKQRDQVTNTLEELRATQNQLIQSEKMASLGELTAGIAHEIQNPLNFVNNFSEVNTELIDEMKKEIDVGNIPQIKNILSDLEQNTAKITHHGKRADNIVKGMLQHSRKSTGQKEPTDINSLVDEYLRLSYHGLRAKDKSFNASMDTNFDNSIGKINIVPQDVGRALLNLFNNAFYAVTEKKASAKVSASSAVALAKEDAKGYEPIVSVSTKKLNDKIEIKIRDNGIGIPQKIVEKIFQPFFTTKPTGQGTGLGLSLSYDIITKEHNGEIKVDTKENEFTEFIIRLPL